MGAAPAVRSKPAEPGWADAGGGIQFRLRPTKGVWAPGETPAFEIDLRGDPRAVSIELAQFQFVEQVEVGGTWCPPDLPRQRARVTAYASNRFLLDPGDEAQLSRAHAAADELFAMAVRLGGTVSGEHGIGLLKNGQLARQWSPAAVALHRSVKEALDPKGLLNPGKKLA